MTKPRWLFSGYWPPALVLLSVLASTALILAGAAASLRLPAAFWIVTFIPGYAVVRLMKFQDGMTNITLSIALSMALSICVSLLLVYTHSWSLAGGVITLAAIAFLASAFEMNLIRRRQAD